MSDEMRTYLVAYDIVDDKRRNHVATLLKHYGERVQYSLFLVEVRPARIITVSSELKGLIDTDTDSVAICDAGLRTQSKKGLHFIGRRGYSDIEIPTVI
ncbi:MAG: CRISPR-associated endonuclease Cas2 [Bifidobacteriaceae bacterium]|jgi:CRISPR-associated protein Cas2|nr:CRISPR-associated endonuclease Cas2 [Bifidobacteriaceae bacterium]